MNAVTPAIEAHGLEKSYEGRPALQGVDIVVQPGECFGYLGPNGAGKTTTINILTGLARPDAGRFSICGIDCTRDPKAAQHLIGVVPDESNLYPELSGSENLRFAASLYGMGKRERSERARELLAMMGLEEAAGRRFGGYSRGMKRRLAIAAGIIHRPRLLFLDEPTSGIDVESARMIRSHLGELKGQGSTIFLTTHFIEEAERLCNRIAFLAGGRVVRCDTIGELLEPVAGGHELAITTDALAPVPLDALRQAFPALEFRAVAKGGLRVLSEEPVPAGEVVRFLEERGVSVMEARRRRLSLEDVFVAVTGIGAASMAKGKEGRR